MAEDISNVEIENKEKAKTDNKAVNASEKAPKSASKTAAQKTTSKTALAKTATKTAAAKTAEDKTTAAKTAVKKTAASAPSITDADKADEKAKTVNKSADKIAAKAKQSTVKDDAKYIKVTLTKSIIGCKKFQIATVKALGLNKIRQSKIIKDTKASRGMINRVSHLVSVSEVKREA